MVSLKLIVEDADIVQKINDNLSPQIRVWGIERTNGSFSCYSECDSRVYEYLIPTHTFLPPHPNSYLGRKLVELAKEIGDTEGLQDRQEEVSTFWNDAEEKFTKPVLDTLDTPTRALVEKALYDSGNNIDGTKAEPGLQSEPRPKAETGENPSAEEPEQVPEPSMTIEERQSLDKATKSLKAAYISAKKAYRINPKRLERIRSVLSLYLGTRNFHNYTVLKSFRDPSAKRLIKSFTVDENPIIINDTEWLSLKVHGQSFMMHQIRKMVTMAALVVRCGCDVNRILDSYGSQRVSIPKAPGLGLLLERPVFDTYNERAVTKFGRAKIDFERYAQEMREFKQREIYQRIFREEEKENQFHTFFSTIDGFRGSEFLYLSSAGLAAVKGAGTGKGGTGDEASRAIDTDSEGDVGPEDG